MTAKIDHYMVDYLDDTDTVRFANDTHLYSLSAAKALASKTSKQHADGAYVVAYVEAGGGSHYDAVGHISFFDGRQSETDGIVLTAA